MFENLKTEDNRVIVMRPQFDRDGDETACPVIGSGYGLFRSKTHEEISSSPKTEFMMAGILTGFVPEVSAFQQYTSKEEQSTATPVTPRAKDYCFWKGRYYTIGGVWQRYSIDGVFMGYWLECADRART